MLRRDFLHGLGLRQIHFDSAKPDKDNMSEMADLIGPVVVVIRVDNTGKVVEVLKSQTRPTARILWEDRRGSRRTPQWAALLPLLTGRPFVGGSYRAPLVYGPDR